MQQQDSFYPFHTIALPLSTNDLGLRQLGLTLVVGTEELFNLYPQGLGVIIDCPS